MQITREHQASPLARFRARLGGLLTSLGSAMRGAQAGRAPASHAGILPTQSAGSKEPVTAAERAAVVDVLKTLTGPATKHKELALPYAFYSWMGNDLASYSREQLERVQIAAYNIQTFLDVRLPGLEQKLQERLADLDRARQELADLPPDASPAKRNRLGAEVTRARHLWQESRDDLSLQWKGAAGNLRSMMDHRPELDLGDDFFQRHSR